MTNKERLAEIVFWLSLFIILFWMVLKILGIIESPVWIESIPYVAATFGAGAFYTDFKYLKKTAEKLERKVNRIGLGLREVEAEISLMRK